MWLSQRGDRSIRLIQSKGLQDRVVYLNTWVPGLTLQRLLGHQRVETTLGYARLYDTTVARDYGRAMAGVEAELKHFLRKREENANNTNAATGY